jgi:ribose transport system permease protein
LTTPTITVDPPTGTSRRRLRFSAPRVIPIVLLVVLFVAGSLTIDGYTSPRSILSLLVLSSFLGLAAMGQTLTIIVGGIDLSVAAVIGMANVMITTLYGGGWDFWAACLVVAAFAIVVGLVNALTTIFLQVNAIITTLGTGLVVLGLVQTWGATQTGGGIPPWLVGVVSVIGTTGPIPVPTIVLLWLLLGAIVVFVQHRTRIGREVYATGANKPAAELAHVRTTRAWIFAFVISALSAAVLGVLFAGYSGTADAHIGDPYLFQTITAVVVGGTSLLGGRGGYGNTIVGVLIISQLTTLLVGAGFSAQLQQALLGVLVILLVSLYGRESHVSGRV